MKVCKAYTEARIAWEKHYAELERRYEEAERAENRKRAERIGDALAEMEQNSGFKKCFACGRKGCPANAAADHCISPAGAMCPRSYPECV